MNKEAVLSRINEIGIVPGIRTVSAEDAHFAADAVSSGGIQLRSTVSRSIGSNGSTVFAATEARLCGVRAAAARASSAFACAWAPSCH